ncbi:hypothetical protein EJP617_28720 [Erwinia sp. Ejp617]|nr:hypothetical protein EJP617_28720 [Erwinia sp. Ejp617]
MSFLPLRRDYPAQLALTFAINLFDYLIRFPCGQANKEML